MIATLDKQPGRKVTSAASGRKGHGPRDEARGIVNFCVRGRAVTNAGRELTPAKLVAALRDGLPVRELDALQAALAVPTENLAPMLGISKATLHRRKLGGRLGPAESDRVVRFARLMGKAAEVMESKEAARAWLTSPQFGLGGAVPLEYAESEVGAREVEDLLGRIEQGVYS
jgi:putative toxin-antitoxin system antitoxin component (TIGR02293 family)